MKNNDQQSDQKQAEDWYAKAGDHDRKGEELEALPCYEKAYELGWRQLPPEDQPRFFVGFGSTLRNCFKFDRSKEILTEAIKEFPDYAPLKVFLALTEYSRKDDRAAAKLLFDVVSKTDLHGFERAARWYAENLDTHPEKR